MKQWPFFSSFTVLCLLVLVVLSGLGSMACGGAGNNGSATNGNTTGLRPTPTVDACASKADKEIVVAIYADIDKDPALQKQHKKIDVLSTYRAVTLWGWVDDKSQYDKVVGIAKNMACVVSVDAANFYDNPNNPTRLDPSGGCNPPLKKCGEICQMPEQCNSVGDPVPGANVNTNTTTK